MHLEQHVLCRGLLSGGHLGKQRTKYFLKLGQTSVSKRTGQGDGLFLGRDGGACGQGSVRFVAILRDYGWVVVFDGSSGQYTDSLLSQRIEKGYEGGSRTCILSTDLQSGGVFLPCEEAVQQFDGRAVNSGTLWNLS